MCFHFHGSLPHPLWLRRETARYTPRLSPTASPAMAAMVAAAVTARLPPRFSAAWLRHGHVSSLRPSLGRPLAVLRVVSASRRSPGDGGKKREKKRRRRATEADQEEGLSVSSGKPSPTPLAPSVLRSALSFGWNQEALRPEPKIARA